MFTPSGTETGLTLASWLGFSSVSGRVRYAGYGRRKILVTDGHEAEAKAAQLRKRPDRIGPFFLRLLGFRDVVARFATVTARPTYGMPL